MKIENWLTIAVIISQLIAPWLSSLFNRSRTAQPAPTPEANQPKNRTQRILGWLARVSNSPWILPPLVILVNIYALLLESHSTAPLTRKTVFQISWAIAGIWYGAVLFFLNTAWQSIRRQWEINRRMSETDAEIIDILKDMTRTGSDLDRQMLAIITTLANGLHVTNESLALMSESLELSRRLQTELDRPRPGRLPKVLAAIKNLLGN